MLLRSNTGNASRSRWIFTISESSGTACRVSATYKRTNGWMDRTKDNRCVLSLSLCLRASYFLPLSFPPAHSTHCSRRITHTIRSAVLRVHPYRTYVRRNFAVHDSDTLRSSRSAAQDHRREAVHGHTSPVGTTRPYVAGTDGGVTRWRRGHRLQRPRGRSTNHGQRPAHTDMAARTRARAQIPRAGIYTERERERERWRIGIYVLLTGAHWRATRTHERREAAAGRIVRQLHSAESIMDIRTDGPPGPPSLPHPTPSNGCPQTDAHTAAIAM